MAKHLGKPRSLTKKQERKKKTVAEKLKGKPGVKNPFALATAIAKGSVKRKRKRGKK